MADNKTYDVTLDIKQEIGEEAMISHTWAR
jgi:hypothetical protein